MAFFATSHGKGPSDGIGGTIKWEAIRASLQRPYHDKLSIPNKLFEFIRLNLHSINSKFVSVDDWHVEEEFLCSQFLGAKAIAGARKLHSFVPTNRSTLEIRNYSCSNES